MRVAQRRTSKSALWSFSSARVSRSRRAARWLRTPESRSDSSMAALFSSTGAALGCGRPLSCARAGSVAPISSNAVIISAAARAGKLITTSLAPMAAREQLWADAQLERRGEQRDLGHRLRDPVVERHGDRLAKRDHAPLEELIVVGGQGIGHELG